MTGRRRERRLSTSTVIVLLVVVVVVAVAAGLVAAWSILSDGTGSRPHPGRADASDPELVARGSAVYAESCASCHGVNLEGQPNWRQRKADGTLPAPPHDETGHTWHHSDVDLFEVTKRGTEAVAGGGYKSDMRGFADELDDADIWAVLAYIKSRWPADIQAEQARR